MKDRSFSTSLHILTTLAFHQPERVCSEDLAVGAKTNAGLIRRLLSKLSKAGIVDTLKGKNGGATLGKPSDQISLLEVYSAVNDGPVFASFEKDPHKPCPISCQIGDVLSGVFKELERPMLEKMESTKLIHIIRQIN